MLLSGLKFIEGSNLAVRRGFSLGSPILLHLQKATLHILKFDLESLSMQCATPKSHLVIVIIYQIYLYVKQFNFLVSACEVQNTKDQFISFETLVVPATPSPP